MVISKEKADQLKELDKKYFLHPTSSIKQHQELGPKVIFIEGDGIYLIDSNGKRFIDGMSSLWNVNIGHSRVEMGEEASRQMSKLSYSSSFANFSNESVIKLSEKIASLTPGDLNVSFFTSGGSEANDTAFKLARHYWKGKGKPEKTKVIGLDRGFHGVTIGSTSATGIPQFHDMSTSNAPGFYYATPFQTNCELGDKSDPNYENSIRGVIEREGSDTVAAIVLEPIQGAGGVRIPPEGYLQAVRKLCDEHNIMLIADEIICGFGRTGKQFGVNNWDIVPDIMTVAKGITSGYIQLGATIMKEYIRDELAEMYDETLFHGYTYSGHPTACALALKNLEIIERENLMGNAKQMESVLLSGLNFLKSEYSIVTNCRAKGLLGAFELRPEGENSKPFSRELKIAERFVDECFKRGLIVRPITYGGIDTIVMAPPLIITKKQINNIVDILSESVKAIQKQLT